MWQRSFIQLCHRVVLKHPHYAPGWEKCHYPMFKTLVHANGHGHVMGWTNDRGHSSAGYSFIHLAVCLTTGPKHLPKRALHIVRSRASSFKWKYPLLSLRSSSSFLRLLPRLPVTSIPPFIFPSITLVEGSFYAKFWPIQLAFRLLISCRISLCSSNLSNTTSFLTRSVQLIFSILLQHHIYVTQNKYE